MTKPPPDAAEKPLAHTATARTIHARIASKLFDPPPTVAGLMGWLLGGKVPYVKANPGAKRGGGTLYFHTAAAEKLLKRKAGLI